MGDTNFFFILFYIFQILYKSIIVFIIRKKSLKYVHIVESLLKYVLLFAISEVTAVVNFGNISVVNNRLLSVKHRVQPVKQGMRQGMTRKGAMQEVQLCFS